MLLLITNEESLGVRLQSFMQSFQTSPGTCTSTTVLVQHGKGKTVLVSLLGSSSSLHQPKSCLPPQRHCCTQQSHTTQHQYCHFSLYLCIISMVGRKA